MPTLIARVFKVLKGRLSREGGGGLEIVLPHCNKVFSCKKKHKISFIFRIKIYIFYI